MTQTIKNIIQASIATKQQILEDENLLKTIEKVKDVMVTAFKNGNKVLFCGNGGSAAGAFIQTATLCHQKHCIAILLFLLLLPTTIVMMLFTVVC